MKTKHRKLITLKKDIEHGPIIIKLQEKNFERNDFIAGILNVKLSAI